ncbi:MAG: YdaU family protein [Methylobacter sp.]
MNYFELHIGDYAEATQHLTFVEDAAYLRMIRKYYATEKPLPVDIKTVQRLVGARDKSEREAVETILNEFFYLLDDGWHNERCDDEIKSFVEGEPERLAKKANEENRLKRHREERSALFTELTGYGLHAPWNIGIKELRDMVFKASRNNKQQPEMDAMEPLPPLPATAPATPATATQTPDTNHQSPDKEYLDTHNNLNTLGELTPGSVCVELRSLGIAQVNPSHPDLLAVIADGATLEQFSFAATEATGKGKGFAYLIAIVKNQIQEKRNGHANKNNNEASAGAGRKPSLVDQGRQSIDRIEARERQLAERSVN